MKKITTLIVLLLSSVAGMSQNNLSQGSVLTTIPASGLGTQEIFRFKPGVFTQLQSGTTTFGFGANDRWLSLGELVTPPSGQRLHGLRIQDEGKALVMGYSSEETNAFIQYIGPRGLDIRYADSFTSTVSNTAAIFAPTGNTFFGFSDPAFVIVNPGGPFDPGNVGTRPPRAQVEIFSRFEVGLRVRKGNNNILAANFLAGDFGGPIVATAATFTSDKQFKQDIKEEESVIERIRSLKPVSYNFVSENKFGFSFPAAIQHGFIAQDVEKVFPELVKNHDEEGVGTYKSVNYTGVIAILTKGIQELSLEVEDLKKQLAEARTYVVTKDNFSKSEIEKISENGFYLGQNTPNPFSNSTEISYTFPKGSKNVMLMVFNLNGETLKEFRLTEEKGSVTLDATQFRPGLYLYSLINDNSEIITKKMLVK